MRKWIQGITLAGALMLLAPPAGAQDYRARVQGTVVDTSQGALPGATVTLTNTATGVAATRVTDTDGRYLFDFVDPGTYTMQRRARRLPGRRSSRTSACRSAATSPSA